ncbi:MAG: ABC transporter substrate-binding protein [Alphaproteobacteria bacterium]|nr:ABC transporter substrate-binding protein [Alphaproteobacteria bacterium]
MARAAKVGPGLHQGDSKILDVVLAKARAQLSRFLCLSVFACCTAHAAGPRVVSLAPCLDTALIHLADRDQIVAVSRYARDARGFTIAEQAKTLPITAGTAEELIALKPDLVLTAFPLPSGTQQVLDRLSIEVRQFPLPESVADNIAEIRAIAALIGHPERGEKLAADIAEALTRAAPAPSVATVEALVFQGNGFASAPGTLMDELMRRVGFSNAASRLGLTQSGYIALERLIVDPPRILLVGDAVNDLPAWADRVTTHPALTALSDRVVRAPFPAKYLYCGGPVIVPAVAALVEARAMVSGS